MTSWEPDVPMGPLDPLVHNDHFLKLIFILKLGPGYFRVYFYLYLQWSQAIFHHSFTFPCKITAVRLRLVRAVQTV